MFVPYEVPISGGRIVRIMEPMRREEVPLAAERTALQLLRSQISESEWADWRRRRAIAMPLTAAGPDSLIHVTPHFVIVEAAKILYGDRNLGNLAAFCVGAPEWESWPIGDMVLALWLLAKYDPKWLLGAGTLQYPTEVLGLYQLVTVHVQSDRNAGIPEYTRR